jgi:Arc/MetJ-type ribon-helix-helix transcriptional regulator
MIPIGWWFMTADVLESPNMAKDKKRAISLTLTDQYLEILEKMSEQTEFHPSVSKFVDQAVREFLETRGKLSKAEQHPARKPPRADSPLARTTAAVSVPLS